MFTRWYFIRKWSTAVVVYVHVSLISHEGTRKRNFQQLLLPSCGPRNCIFTSEVPVHCERNERRRTPHVAPWSLGRNWTTWTRKIETTTKKVRSRKTPCLLSIRVWHSIRYCEHSLLCIRWVVKTLIGGEEKLLRKKGTQAVAYHDITGEWPRAICLDEMFDLMWDAHQR